MAILKSLSLSLVESLYPKTLYDFGQYLSAKEGATFHLEQNELLVELSSEIDSYLGIETEEVRTACKEAKSDFLAQLGRIEKEDLDNAANDRIRVLLDDLRKCSTDEMVNRLEALARGQFPYKNGLPYFEYAVRFLLYKKDEALLSRVIREAGRKSRRGFCYYGLAEGTTPFGEEKMQPGEAFDKRFNADIRDIVATRYGYRFCPIASELLEDGRWFIEVRHAGKKRKQEAVKNDEAEDAVLSPVETDIIVYNPKNKEIKIYMQSKSVRFMKKAYVDPLGEILGGGGYKWEIKGKFDLRKFLLPKKELAELLRRGGEALSSVELPVKVLLTEIHIKVKSSAEDADREEVVEARVSFKESKKGILFLLQEGQSVGDMVSLRNSCVELRGEGCCEVESVSLAVVPVDEKALGRYTVKISNGSLNDPNRLNVENWLEEEGIAHLSFDEKDYNL